MPKKIAKIVKVHKQGGSFMIVLPPEFCHAHNIKEDDQVGILANHLLLLHPMKDGEFEEIETEAPLTNPMPPPPETAKPEVPDTTVTSPSPA